MRKVHFFKLIVFFTLFFPVSFSAISAINSNPTDYVTSEKVRTVSMPFIENKGQIEDKNVQFYAKTFAGSFYVTNKGEIIHGVASDKKIYIREAFAGNREISVKGVDKSPAKINYFLGEKKNWKTNISSWQFLTLGKVFEGVGVKLAVKGENVEKLFFLDKGADVKDIKVKLTGAKSLMVNAKGELEAVTDEGIVRFTKPVAYQDIEGDRVYVDTNYRIIKTASSVPDSKNWKTQENIYGFSLSLYDKDYPIVIDPLLASTFAGGDDDDYVYSIALDSSGNIFVAGYTESSDYPVTSGSYDEGCGSDSNCDGGESDIIITKFDANLTTISAATFLGGSDEEKNPVLSVDSSDNVYVSGYTSSSDFPSTSGAYDEGCGSDSNCDVDSDSNTSSDIFISRLSNDLATLSVSTFLGGSFSEYDPLLTMDSSSGNVIVAGYTFSSDFPVTPTLTTYDKDYNKGADVFVAILDSGLSSVITATYLGGGDWDNPDGIALDSSGNIFVAGTTYSSDFDTQSSAYDNTANGEADVFVTKFLPDLTDISGASSTYIGGSDSDFVYGIAIDSSDKPVIAGYTYSSDYPVVTDTATAYDSTYNNNGDIFVSRLANDLKSLENSTFIGGNNWEDCYAFIIDSSGNVYLTGRTLSSDFPVTSGAYDESQNGDTDVFVTKVSSDFSQVSASTFLGGGGAEFGNSIVIDSSDNVILSGGTSSSDFPVTLGAYDTKINEGKEYFVAKLDSDLSEDAGGGGGGGGGGDTGAKPSITSIASKKGSYGAVVTISGTDFGNNDGTATFIRSGVKVDGEIKSWADTEVVITVPWGAKAGTNRVKVTNSSSGKISNAKFFKYIKPGAVITKISSAKGKIDDVITVSGKNFGPEEDSSLILFKKMEADVTAWTDTVITTVVPELEIKTVKKKKKGKIKKIKKNKFPIKVQTLYGKSKGKKFKLVK